MPPLYTVTQRLLPVPLIPGRTFPAGTEHQRPHFDATNDMKIKVNELIKGKAGHEENPCHLPICLQEIRYMG